MALSFAISDAPLTACLEKLKNLTACRFLLLFLLRYFLNAIWRKIEMVDEHLISRITANPIIFGGKPIIRGMRISVELILSLLAQGETTERLLEDYPELEPQDIRACLACAHAVKGFTDCS